MIEFGFKLSKGSTVDLDKVDLSIYNQLVERVPSAKSCMSCGSCSASCVAASFSGMSVRKVLLALQRGGDVRGLLSNCMLCGKCTMVCPRGINTRDLILTVCKLYDR